MKLVWDNAPNGVVSVSADGMTYVTPILTGKYAATMDRGIAQWEGTVADECALHTGFGGHTLPVPWGMAHVHVESGWNQFARNPDGGVGLLQITSKDLKGSHTDDELMQDAALNLKIGFGYLASLWADRGIDLVATTSMWNGGRDPQTRRPHPMAASPYGFVETIQPPGARKDPSVPITYDHITAIIRANNYYILRGTGIGSPLDVANLGRGNLPNSPPNPAARPPNRDGLALALGLLLLGAAAT